MFWDSLRFIVEDDADGEELEEDDDDESITMTSVKFQESPKEIIKIN